MIWSKILAALLPYLLGAGVLLLIALGIWNYGSNRYDAGFAEAQSKCNAAAIQSKLDAMTADRDAARAAETNAKALLEKAEADAKSEMEGVAEYVEELKSRPVAACLLTDDDLRGMRIDIPAATAAGKP